MDLYTRTVETFCSWRPNLPSLGRSEGQGHSVGIRLGGLTVITVVNITENLPRAFTRVLNKSQRCGAGFLHGVRGTRACLCQENDLRGSNWWSRAVNGPEGQTPSPRPSSSRQSKVAHYSRLS